MFYGGEAFKEDKGRVHIAWSPLYFLNPTTDLPWRGAEQGNLHLLFSHSCAFPESNPNPA